MKLPAPKPGKHRMFDSITTINVDDLSKPKDRVFWVINVNDSRSWPESRDKQFEETYFEFGQHLDQVLCSLEDPDFLPFPLLPLCPMQAQAEHQQPPHQRNT